MLVMIAEIYWWALTGGDGDDFLEHMSKSLSPDKLTRAVLDINLGQVPLGDQLSEGIQRVIMKDDDVVFYGDTVPVIGTAYAMFDHAGPILDWLNGVTFGTEDEAEWEETQDKAMKGLYELALALGQLRGLNVTPLARQVGQVYKKRFRPVDYMADYRAALRELTDIPETKRTDEQWIELSRLTANPISGLGSSISAMTQSINSGYLPDEQVEYLKQQIDTLQQEQQREAAKALGVDLDEEDK